MVSYWSRVGPFSNMIAILISEEIWTQTQTERRWREDIQGASYLQAKERDWEQSFPHHPQKKPTLPKPWFWTFDLQHPERIHFNCWNHPGVVLCYGSPSKLIHLQTMHTFTQTKTVNTLSLAAISCLSGKDVSLWGCIFSYLLSSQASIDTGFLFIYF